MHSSFVLSSSHLLYCGWNKCEASALLLIMWRPYAGVCTSSTSFLVAKLSQVASGCFCRLVCRVGDSSAASGRFFTRAYSDGAVFGGAHLELSPIPALEYQLHDNSDLHVPARGGSALHLFRSALRKLVGNRW